MLKNIFRFFTVILLASIFFTSCTKEEQIYKGSELDNMKHFVSVDKAIDIAQSLNIEPNKNNGFFKRKMTKSCKSVTETEIISNDTVASFYVINFANNSGFVIISADTRAFPILAYSTESNFEVDSTNLGLEEWININKLYIDKVRDGSVSSNQFIEEQWELLIYPDNIDPEDPCMQEPTFITVGPLLNTNWGQGCNYNDLCPVFTNNYCNHAPTGCLATAMAQIMRYHSYPSTYNWSTMPNNSGSAETARLMKNIGVAVNMEYGSSGSSADTEAEGRSSFVNDFGYSADAQYINYYDGSNYTRVVSSVGIGRPVLMRGGRKAYWGGIIPYYADGHAWVCDGYMSYYDPCLGYGSLHLHMNWGWNGSSNGWFAFNNFNPGSYTFNYKTGAVINIHP